MSISAIIIDDEKFARNDLSHMLLDHPEISVIGEAGNIAEAKNLLARVTPDVVFLDIRLQGGSGFELVSHIPPNSEIIFYTAHDAYALRAFEVNALDYLLKPVTTERLAATLHRLRQQHEHPHQAPKNLKRLRTEDCIFIRTRKEQQFIEVKTILAVTASGGNYTNLHLESGNRTLVRRTMKAWAHILPDQIFFRIHRASIVNLQRIYRLKKETNGTVLAHLSGISKPLEVSRRSLSSLKQLMQNFDMIFS